MAWFDGLPLKDVALPVTVVDEILFGLLTMPQGRKRDEKLARFGRLLSLVEVWPIDRDAAERSADLRAQRQLAGRNLSLGDSQIGGLALSRGARVASRDTYVFDWPGVVAIDPWAGGA